MRPILPLLCAVLLAARLPVLAAPATAPASAPRVPIAAFTNDDQYAMPRLAPDGKHIAITVRTPAGERPVPMVTVYSLPELKVEGVIRMPAFEVPLAYRWVSNTRLVISRGLELGSREKPVSTGELIATDYDGKKQEYLHGYRMFQQSSRGRYPNDEAYGYIEDVARDFNGHVMVTSLLWDRERTMLYDIDTRNGVRRLAAELPAAGMAFLIQHDGTPRFAYGTDEKNYTQLFRRDDTTGAWDKVSDMGHRYKPIGFSGDDSHVAALFSKAGEPEALVRDDVKTGARTTLFSDRAAEPAGLLFGPGRGMPFGARSAIGIPHAVYFDENDENARLHKLLSQQFAGSWVGFHSFSADGKLLLFSVSSDRDPGSYYLFNRSTNTADLLFSAMQGIDPDRMAERRPISFSTRDNHTLYGFLTMPADGAGAKPPPMVLLPHGGPHGVADEWFFDTDAQFLASRGYAVLQVNFRGSDGRGSAFMHAGYREWGGKVQDDLVDGVNWAVKQGLVDPNRICVYGASFGGYSALMLAAREPAMFKCAVGYAGVYDLNLMATTDEAKGNKRLQAQLKRYIGTDKSELDRFSPALLAAKIKAPVLLVHGGKDKRAPLNQAEAMRAALIQAGHPPEWFVAPDEGHGFYDTKNVTEFYQRLESFLGKHLGP